MKNARKIVSKSMLLLILIIAYSCGFNGDKPDCPECDCEEIADETYNNGIIFPDKARELYNNYENRRIRLIEDYESTNDKKDYQPQQNKKEQNRSGENTTDSSDRQFMAARYVSYEYEDLKKYLAYIENEAKLSGEKLSTMRFYFANYADEEKFEDGKPVLHPRQNSIMMSPTVKKDGNEHIFFTEDAEEGKRKIVLLDNDFNRWKGGEGNQQKSETKSEASLVPSFLFPSSPAFMYAPRSTTKNEGHSNP